MTRYLYYIVMLYVLLGGVATLEASMPDTGEALGIRIETDHLAYVISHTGENLAFVDKRAGVDYCAKPSSFSYVTKDDKEYSASTVAYDRSSGVMTVCYEDIRVTAMVRVSVAKDYFTLEVESIDGPDIDLLTFVDIELTNTGTVDDVFPACAVAMNYNTRVYEIPGSNKRLKAYSYRRTGITNGKVAIVATRRAGFRDAIKQAAMSIDAVDDMAISTRGGPWAMDYHGNYDSYVFCIGNLTTETVGDWITFCRDIGVKQIDLTGYTHFTNEGSKSPIRWGDYALNPGQYPNGRRDLTEVIQELHDADIQVCLHNYSYFISKASSYVTPVPHPDLHYDGEFTLSADIDVSADVIPVEEDTGKMSTAVTYENRSSVILRIEDELIVYDAIEETAPFSFGKCTRGALGTTASSHPKGAQVYNLKEIYNCLLPDPCSELFVEIAENIAGLYNECNFDMLYFDAMDTRGFTRPENREWGRVYYDAIFAKEVFKRLNTVPMIETSSRRNHYLWFLRSRMGATDHPFRAYKKYIDLHVEENLPNDNRFLPSHLGWWVIKLGLDNQEEPTFSDVTEYLCTKAIGWDAGLSFQRIGPGGYSPGEWISGYRDGAYRQRTVDIIRTYETLRLNHYFSEEVKAQFRVPGAEFTVEPDGPGAWAVYPARYDKHKVEGIDGISNTWQVVNEFDAQPIWLRIEVLQSPNGYDSSHNAVLVDFADPDVEFPINSRATAPSVCDLHLTCSDKVKQGAGFVNSGCFEVRNAGSERNGAWTKLAKEFQESPNQDRGPYEAIAKALAASSDASEVREAMGVWIHGDGKGEILNFQFPAKGTSYGRGEHYVKIDFDGWRYFELIEPDAQRFYDYSWPYSNTYNKFNHHWKVRYNNITEFNIWYNDLPANDSATCYISPVKLIHTNKVKLSQCSVTVNGEIITFPYDIESGMFLEFYSADDCTIYNSDGSLGAKITPQGSVPILRQGINNITFTCTNTAGLRSRANVTIMSKSRVSINAAR